MIKVEDRGFNLNGMSECARRQGGSAFFSLSGLNVDVFYSIYFLWPLCKLRYILREVDWIGIY